MAEKEVARGWLWEPGCELREAAPVAGDDPLLLAGDRAQRRRGRAPSRQRSKEAMRADRVVDGRQGLAQALEQLGGLIG